jgi:tetratricopeptide (TPR) repeat protein
MYNGTNRYEEALPNFEKAIALDSNYLSAWNNLGFAYLNISRFAEAEGALKKVIKLNPAIAIPRRHLGMVCFKTKRPDEARQHFLKAIALNPNYAGAMLGMACLLHSEGKTAEALGYIEQAISKGSTFDQLEKDPDLAPLRATPECKALMKKHFPDQIKD